MLDKPDFGEVLSTRDTRAQLPTLLKNFRGKKEGAKPVVVGANRKAEAVFMSWDSYRAIMDYLDDIAIAGEVERRQEAAGNKRLSESEFLKAVGSNANEIDSLKG